MAKGLTLGAVSSGADEPVVAVQHHGKPPYRDTKNGKPAELLIERTIGIFKRANVKDDFQEIPPVDCKVQQRFHQHLLREIWL